MQAQIFSVRPIYASSHRGPTTFIRAVLADIIERPINKVSCVIITIKRKTVAEVDIEVKGRSEEGIEVSVHMDGCLVCRD